MADQADDKASGQPATVSVEASSLGDQLKTIKQGLASSPVRREVA